MNEWQRFIGVGERQTHRRSDAPSTRVENVEGEHRYSAGFHIQHWDGRQDAVVTPEPVKLKAEVKNGIVQALHPID